MSKPDDIYFPIPHADLQYMVNKSVHVEGHGRGAHYILVNYSATQATVYNRSTKMTLNSIPIERLRYTRKHEERRFLYKE